MPILGPRSKAHLDGALGALAVKLDPAQVARLDAASAVEAGTPARQISASELQIAGGRQELVLAKGFGPA